METMQNKDQNNQEEILNKILMKLEEKENLSQKRYFRNKDLKSVFGLSSNTISKYRDDGILPYTMLGEIYLYPIAEVEKRLKKNSSYK